MMHLSPVTNGNSGNNPRWETVDEEISMKTDSLDCTLIPAENEAIRRTPTKNKPPTTSNMSISSSLTSNIVFPKVDVPGKKNTTSTSTLPLPFPPSTSTTNITVPQTKPPPKSMSSFGTQTEVSNFNIDELYADVAELTEKVKTCFTKNSIIDKLQRDIDRINRVLPELSAQILVNKEKIETLVTAETLSKKMGPLIVKLKNNSEMILENEKKLLELTTKIRDGDFTTRNQEHCTTIENIAATTENHEEQLTTIMNDMSEIEDEVFSVVNKKKESEITKLKQRIMFLERKLQDSPTQPSTSAAEPRPDSSAMSNPNKPKNKFTFDHNTLLIGDSNTRTIDMRRMGKGTGLRKRVTCYHTTGVKKFLTKAEFLRNPSNIMLHVGTNDIVYHKGDWETVLLEIEQLIGELRTRFPDARIHVSSVFNRKDLTDPLNDPIQKLNAGLNALCRQFR